MKQGKWKTYAFWILLTEAVGLIAGILTRDAVSQYSQIIQKPPLAPPGWLFPVVWTILYALMGIAAARIWLAEDSNMRDRAINLYLAQLIVNFFWPLFFFNLMAYGFSVIWLLLLWGLVLLTILQFWKIDRVAAWLLVPYLAWLTFAVYLNLGVWVLNG